MKHTAMTSAQEAEILRLFLEEDRMAGDIAMRLALSRSRIQSVLDQYGWPDKDTMRTALEGFRSEEAGAPVPEPHQSIAQSPHGKALALVPVNDLHPDPDNPRDTLPDIEELAESIDAQGLIQPIVARRRGGRLIVVAGHRRLAAVQLLKWSTVDVVITRDMPSDDVLAQQLVENGQRAGLDPIEEGRALNRLKAMSGLGGWELGRKIGRSQSYVDGRLRLLSLSLEDQELVRSGQMNIGEAVEKARTDSGTAAGPRSQYAFHLGASHPLAARVRARCRKVHGRARLVGSVGCGECWETVIRTDERETLHTHSAQTGRCALCNTPAEPSPVAVDEASA